MGEVSAEVDKLTKATQLPAGYSFDIRGAGEEIDAIFKPMIVPRANTAGIPAR